MGYLTEKRGCWVGPVQVSKVLLDYSQSCWTTTTTTTSSVFRSDRIIYMLVRVEVGYKYYMVYIIILNEKCTLYTYGI